LLSTAYRLEAAERVVGLGGITMNRLLRFLQSDDGTTAVEYAVMLALIIGSCVGAIGFFGGEAGGSLIDTSDRLDTAMNN
jgi:pilus assembly protein Flp/PilA